MTILEAQKFLAEKILLQSRRIDQLEQRITELESRLNDQPSR